MPKHIRSEHYLSRPYEVLPTATIHPGIEHHPNDAEHYLLPAVFTVKKGDKFNVKYPGPGVLYITEGEIEYEDTANPGCPVILSAGAVLHVEKDSVLRWYSPSVGKGFCAFWVPTSVKGFDSFVVSG